MNKATWKNKKRTISGQWEYIWQSDSFVIVLNSIDRITGERKRIVTSNDTPEWGNWKLVKMEDKK